MNVKRILIIPAVALIGLTLIFGGYAQWNSANPDKTCASCHEISPSVNLWHESSHRNIGCTECHGTAISNGFHSLTEKVNMVFTHLEEGKRHDEIRMTENQVLELSERCAKCHQSEYAKWQSGGHSANYANIFMNGLHNQKEQPYWGCLRCHGMFYDGNINTLLQKTPNSSGEWSFLNGGIASVPTIPCLACHGIHTGNEQLGMATRLDDPKEISYARPLRYTSLAYYIRADRRHIRADLLTKIAMSDLGKPVKVADDPATRLCMQCHSPNFKHQAGSQDDHTPTGVHEGLSCLACHVPHSNDARNSCSQCHPAISNCKLDVTKMNTSFADKNSPNNIHSMNCLSCHADGKKRKSANILN